MQSCIAADSAYPHGFTFNDGISICVYCHEQAEIDALWSRSTDGGGEEQPCGWLKDKYGRFWQIVSYDIEKFVNSADSVRVSRVNAALMKMKKIGIRILQDAYEG
jgi:predicted 3-demethylubiquinone-9 3-methyltransferase (glyoxalase superfamily)